jgi:hypothetical protein
MTGKGLAPAPGAPSAAPVGIVLVCLGSAAVAFGWTMAAFMVVVGRSLTARKRHLLCVVVAALECLWMPFGTILGIFTLLLIMKPHVRALFVVGTPAR